MSERLAMKILIAGDGAVGKTTLLYRFKEGRFFENARMTLGVDFSLKTINIDEYTVDLQLWDLGGQDRFRFMLHRYVEGARGALLLVDLTCLTSFDNLEGWIDMLRASDEELPILLVGTKNDLVDEIQVDDEFAIEFIPKLKLFKYIKTSSKSGENIESCFDLLVRKIIEL